VIRVKTSLLLLFLLALLGLSCQRSPQEKAAGYLGSGKKYLDHKDYARATIQFRNAARLLPKDAEPQYQLGLAYLGAGDLNAAVAALFRATQLDPRHVGARVKIAGLLARSSDSAEVKEGEKRMRELLVSSPGNTEALDVLALSELRLGDIDNAEKHLHEALRRLPTSLSSSKELAVVYLRRRDFRSAEDVLKKAQAAAPQLADTSVAIGQFYLFTGRLVDAEAAFQSALRLSPTDPSALLGFAAVETGLGKNAQAEDSYRKLAGLSDKRYQHLHAAYLFAQGQREAATKEFEKLAKASPNDRDARNRVVAAYIVSGRIADAEKALGSALKSNPNDVDALLQRSQILARSGKDQEAENDLNRVIHFRPDSAGAHYVLAQIYRSRGNRSRENAELSEVLRFNPGFLQARTELAQLLALSGSPKGALDVLSNVPEAQKNNLTVLLERNVANLAAGDHAAFREGVAQALRVARTPDTLLQDVVAKFIDKDYAGARASVDEALKLAPENLRALQAKVYTYTVQNQRKAAVEFLAEYAAQSKSAAVQEYAGEWLWSQGAHDLGRGALMRAKTTDPQDLRADVALAHADLSEGKLDRARATLMRVLAADPGNFSARILLASLETQAENPQEAIEQYRRALQQQPHNPLVLNNLAYLLAWKGNQADQALPYAQQALELNPGSADAAGTLGWVLFKMGLYREALPLLTQAASQDRDSTQPNVAIRRYHLAMTYLKLGDKRKGLEALRQALEKNPNLEEARMAQALLR
jgi:tetratricopeptide (TPR) repeat protein